MTKILYIEPFSAGSHARFGDVMCANVRAQWTRLELPGRHWKWRMRSCAAYAALAWESSLASSHDLLFASSYVPLAELLGLVPGLARVPSVLYFHENQLAYPSQGTAKERDMHYGFTQLVSALAASCCAFNSAFNRDSFLETAADLLDRMPSPIPPGWVDRIQAKSVVLPVPLELDDTPLVLRQPTPDERRRGPLIVWNHRWEHDKDPQTFFEVLFELQTAGIPFQVAVLGERYRRCPEIFGRARDRLGERLVAFGFVPSAADYRALLERAHLAVSTAKHEFFGVSMLEATHAGARPLVPDGLAYPEIFPESYRYRGAAQLAAALRGFCEDFVDGADPLRADRRELTQVFAASRVARAYEALFDRLRVTHFKPADG